MADGRNETGGTYARRVRAAVAYKGLDPAELAEPGLSERTIYRYMETGGPLSPNGGETRLRIARVCDVPEWFMERGFNPPPEVDQAVRLAQLADDLAVLQRRVEELREEAETP
jgi:hypothetical protein